MYVHHVWQHQINIKLYVQIDVNVWHQFDATVDTNLMLTVEITKLSFLTYGGWSVDVNCWRNVDVNSTFVAHWVTYYCIWCVNRCLIQNRYHEHCKHFGVVLRLLYTWYKMPLIPLLQSFLEAFREDNSEYRI